MKRRCFLQIFRADFPGNSWILLTFSISQPPSKLIIHTNYHSINPKSTATILKSFYTHNLNNCHTNYQYTITIQSTENRQQQHQQTTTQTTRTFDVGFSIFRYPSTTSDSSIWAWILLWSPPYTFRLMTHPLLGPSLLVENYGNYCPNFTLIAKSELNFNDFKFPNWDFA